MQEVENRGHCSGQNIPEVEKFASSVYRKPSEIEPWLPLNVNRKSWTAYHLPANVIA